MSKNGPGENPAAGPVFIGIGANLDSPVHGPPLATCAAAVRAISRAGIAVLRRARWYRSAPVPASDQPWFVNGVIEVAAELAADEILARLHRIEDDFGRARRRRNEARVLDLDLLAYGGLVQEAGTGPALPHPRLHQRAFVLLPLLELAPDWRHPLLGRAVRDLAAELPAGQQVEAIDEEGDGGP